MASRALRAEFSIKIEAVFKVKLKYLLFRDVFKRKPLVMYFSDVAPAVFASAHPSLTVMPHLPLQAAMPTLFTEKYFSYRIINHVMALFKGYSGNNYILFCILTIINMSENNI